MKVGTVFVSGSHGVRLAAAALVVLGGIPVGVGASAQSSDPIQFIVGFTNPSGNAPGDDVHGGRVLEANEALGFDVVETSDPVGFQRRAENDPNVRYVERNPRLKLIVEPTARDVHQAGPQSSDAGALYNPSDGFYGSDQYGPQQVRADLAWDTTLGDLDARVCIIDTGIRYSHNDFAGGRYLGGYDYVNADPDPWDDNGHGTHVAGIAAATIDNAYGIAGMANVGLYAVKALGLDGYGTWVNIANAIQWCADHGGARTVINLSLGCYPGCFSQAVADALASAQSRGLLVVASAGNSGPCTDCVSFPADQPTVLAVGCTTSLQNLCSFSSSGPEVSLSAPGEEIISTWYSGDNMYGWMSGTSMSAPHVSGAAALYWSWDTAISSADLRNRLRDTTKDLGAAGPDRDFGTGQLDAKCLIDGGDACLRSGPANDAWAAATTLSGSSGELSQSTGGATVELGEPLPCDMSATVWHRFTAPGSGVLYVDTFGSNYDTVLAAYTGSDLGSLTQLACNDQYGGDQSQVSFAVSPGVVYHIQAGGWAYANPSVGSLTLHYSLAQQPSNDQFAMAAPIGASPATVTGTNAGATGQTGEPLPCAMSPNTVWHTFTPTATGLLTIDTFGSDFDTVLAVYTGATVATLLQVACNDQSGGDQSLVSFSANAAVTYSIQVGGWNHEAGDIVLNVGRPSMTSLVCPTQFARDEPGVCTFVAQAAAPSVSYLVSWGDGTSTLVPAQGAVAPGITQSASHAYATLGQKKIQVSATNNAGMTSLAIARYVQVLSDISPPAITSLDPAGGYVYRGCTKEGAAVPDAPPVYMGAGCIRATVSDPQSGLTSVKFFFDGWLVGSWTNPAAGTFEKEFSLPAGFGATVDVVVLAVNGAGQTSSHTVLVSAASAGPTPTVPNVGVPVSGPSMPTLPPAPTTPSVPTDPR